MSDQPKFEPTYLRAQCIPIISDGYGGRYNNNNNNNNNNIFLASSKDIIKIQKFIIFIIKH